MLPKKRIVFSAFCAALLCLPMTAEAHKVNIFAYAEGGVVFTESYFADGHPVATGKVLVYDSAGALLVEGVTDDDGLFSFPAPKVDDLTIEIDAGMGHKNRFVLKKADLAE